MHPKKDKGIWLLNSLGIGAYSCCALQWLWAVVFYTPLLVTWPAWTWLLPSHDSSPPPPMPAVAESAPVPESVSWIIFGIAIVILAGFFYFIVRKVPGVVGRVGKSITHSPAEVIVPAVQRKLHMTPKSKKQLSQTIIVGMKALLIVVPFISLLWVAETSKEVTPEQVWIVGLWLFSWSLGLFLVQFLLSWLFKKRYSDIV